MSLSAPVVVSIAVIAFTGAVARVRGSRQSLKAFLAASLVAVAGAFAALAIDRQRPGTPPSVVAVPPAPPDAGVDADGEKPSTMLAAPSEDEQRAMWDSLHRSGS